MALVAIGFFAMSGCSSDVANRNPVGETFPTVRGNSLGGSDIVLPDDFQDAKRPVLLLVAYKQNAQFDVDRWLLGILQAGVEVTPYEIPTVEGLVPGMIANTIDDGMRSGIPDEDWASVVTVYEDAEKIVAFTGNEDPLNTRVLLLDETGKVVWFHDEGYSARVLLELQDEVEAMGTGAARNESGTAE